MKKRWKIFWIVCGSMFLAGIICCSVSWGMGTTLTDIARQFPHGISWISEDEDWDDADEEDEEDIEDDQDEEDDQNERKQEETAASQEKETMKDATGIIEGNGKAAYQNIREIKSTVGAGRIHLKTQPDTDEITVESKDTHKKLGFRAYAKDGILYLTSNKKITKTRNVGKGTITVTLPADIELEEVELNKNYAMIISTSCGLWRYMIGDTVKFTSKNPYKFIITGRTKHFINAFGEELIVDNAEKGLIKACAMTGAQVSDYSAAPVFMDEHAKCRHQWLIEFAKMPDSIENFAAILDTTLKEVNSDYEAKRWKDIALQPLEVIVARKGLFHDWLAKKGKLGGQHKIPRLSNTREYIEEMLELNKA